MLGRTEMRTRDRMYCQTIRSVWDISRGDRARIATCSLRTSTDRLKANYSIDIDLQLFFFLIVFFASWCIYLVVTWARACGVWRLNVFECVRMMTQMFVPCMLVCSAADALVIAAGCCFNIWVHFVTAVFARGAKKNSLYYIVSCRPTDMPCEFFIFTLYLQWCKLLLRVYHI